MKLMICIPLSWPWVPTEFMISLLQLLGGSRLFRTLQQFGIDKYYHLINRNFPLDRNRHELVDAALEAGCEWTLWLDADMTFPPNLVEALCQRQAQTGCGIVSATYFSKHPPHRCVGGDMTDGNDHQLIVPPAIPTDEGKHEAIQVDVIGMGAALINTKVFRDIGPPYFRYSTYEKTGVNSVSEDVWFCNQARHKGWKIVMDPDIRCGHIGTTIFEQGHNLAYMAAREQLIAVAK